MSAIPIRVGSIWQDTDKRLVGSAPRLVSVISERDGRVWIRKLGEKAGGGQNPLKSIRSDRFHKAYSFVRSEA